MGKKYEIHSWRKNYDPRPEFGKVYPFEPATKIFDQLTFIGDPIVCCYLLETEDGLVLIDAMNPEQRYLDAIVQGIRDTGYEPEDLKVILLTHGHGDHYGLSGKLREMSGAKIYMTETDYDLARNITVGRFPPMDWEVDGYLTDGQDFTFGGTTIHCVLTPGHTQGCMSYIIPVTEAGQPHTVALWGGTGLLPDVNIYQYLMSLDKFSRICADYGVDGAISNHPSCDNGIARVRYCREIMVGLPNPYIWTREQVLAYENKFRQMCYDALPSAVNGIVQRRKS